MSDLIAPRRRRVLLMLLACLGLAVPLVAMQSASAANTAPTQIVITGITSGVTDPKSPDLTPTYVFQAGAPFYVDVKFLDAYGNPASFNTDTTLAISSSAGTLTPSTGTAYKNDETAHLPTSLSAAANQISLTVSVAGGRGARTVTPGTSSPDQLFDVVSQLQPYPASPNQSFTGGIDGGGGTCTDATRETPVCGVVMLPNGAASNVLLSAGVCDATSYTPCSTKGAVIQTLFADGGLYSDTAPATLLMKCDKSRCGTGPIQSVPAYYSLGVTGALQSIPACPAKNTVGTDPSGNPQEMCVDWVQSKRDGSGDTYLYILFTKDARVGMG